jgi:hypothetical protein
MANKYMKKISASLVVKEMQVEMTLRVHLAPLSRKHTSVGEDVRGGREP